MDLIMRLFITMLVVASIPALAADLKVMSSDNPPPEHENIQREESEEEWERLENLQEMRADELNHAPEKSQSREVKMKVK